MTLSDIKDILVAVDPGIQHYFSMSKGNYSYWEERNPLPFTADDRHEEAWHFYVHRYTKDHRDQIAADLFAALDGHPAIAVRYETDYDRDTGYIHHIYECEAY